jgi:hypothetical protein
MGANKEAYEPVQVGGSDYETVAASQTAQVLGTAGSVGDFIGRLIITVGTAATGTVALLDNATSIPITAANTPIGVYTVEIGARSVSGPWKITTGAGATVLAVGKFSV